MLSRYNITFMSRETYVLIDGELVLKSKDGHLTEEYCHRNNSNKKNPFQGFGSDKLGDNVNGVFNPADCKYYDSKSEFNKAVRAKGCRIVGNDYNNKVYRRPAVRGDFNVRPQLKTAIERINWGN
jgi:hypothetical protein